MSAPATVVHECCLPDMAAAMRPPMPPPNQPAFQCPVTSYTMVWLPAPAPSTLTPQRVTKQINALPCLAAPAELLPAVCHRARAGCPVRHDRQRHGFDPRLNRAGGGCRWGTLLYSTGAACWLGMLLLPLLHSGSHLIPSLLTPTGGGTVDVSMHDVQLQGGQAVLSEHTIGEAALAGATFVDRKWECWMQERLGQEAWADWKVSGW